MGLTIIDAGILIGFFDQRDLHHVGAVNELANAQRRGDRIAIRASGFAEALASPSRVSDSPVATIRDFVEQFPLDVEEITFETALVAAKMRAQFGQRVKLPDALVIACAIERQATTLVTADRVWPLKHELDYGGDLILL